MVTEDGYVGLGENYPDEALVVDGNIRLTVGSGGDSSEFGTIMFTGDNFWGRTDTGWLRMTSATTSTTSELPGKEELAQLKSENEALWKSLNSLEKRMELLETKIDNK